MVSRQKLARYIAEDSPDTAERIRSEIREAFQRLGQSPGIGHYHEELLDRRYRFWNFYSYVVCYVWQRKPCGVRVRTTTCSKVVDSLFAERKSLKVHAAEQVGEAGLGAEAV